MGIKVLTPSSYEEVLSIIKDSNGDMIPIAGGTDLIVDIKHGRVSPKTLVDLSNIKENREITIKDNILEIGSLVTHAQIASSPLLINKYKALKIGAKLVGGPQIRNAGTIGGNIETACPAADLPPVLLAMNSKLSLDSIDGSREVLLEDYFLGGKNGIGKRKTILRPSELIGKIIIDLDDSFNTVFLKVGRRNSLAISVVNLAASLELDSDGKCSRAFVALGCVAAIPKRAYNVEEFLIGKEINSITINKAREILETDITPRSNARYKTLAAKSLLSKALIDIKDERRVKKWI